MTNPEHVNPIDPNERWTNSLSALAAAQEAHINLLCKLASSDSDYKAFVTGRVHRKYGIFLDPLYNSPHQAVVELKGTAVENFWLYPDVADANSDIDPELIAGCDYYVDTPGGLEHRTLFLTADNLASLEWRFAEKAPVDI